MRWRERALEKTKFIKFKWIIPDIVDWNEITACYKYDAGDIYAVCYWICFLHSVIQTRNQNLEHI